MIKITITGEYCPWDSTPFIKTLYYCEEDIFNIEEHRSKSTFYKFLHFKNGSRVLIDGKFQDHTVCKIEFIDNTFTGIFSGILKNDVS